MTELDVRVVRLEPFRVVSVLGFGEGPEVEAIEKILAFAHSKGLLGQEKKPRFFGFNNPDPSPGSPNYGYEMWVEVGPEVAVEEPYKVIEIPGGTYVVTRCKGVETIHDTWKRLNAYLEKSSHHYGRHQWLEEHLNIDEPDFNNYELDLYLPIRG